MAFLRPLLLLPRSSSLLVFCDLPERPRNSLAPLGPMALWPFEVSPCACKAPLHILTRSLSLTLCPSHAPAFGWGVTPMVAPRGLGGYASLISWSPFPRALLLWVPRASQKRPYQSSSSSLPLFGPTGMIMLTRANHHGGKNRIVMM